MNDELSQELIHIDWSGPHSLDAVGALNGPTHYGVYQVYGTHHVYGSGVLLYIGRAVDQTFAVRLAQEMGCWRNNPDPNRVEVYIGRLWGPKEPDAGTWNRQIELAERLLIHAHEPAQNAQKEISQMGPELSRVHVINWHCYRDLLPEVSGAAWAGESCSAYRHFGSND